MKARASYGLCPELKSLLNFVHQDSELSETSLIKKTGLSALALSSFKHELVALI